MKTRLEKFRVCDCCLAVIIINNDCICTYGKYTTIELEFEVCCCCGNLINDGNPADTEFNTAQLAGRGLFDQSPSEDEK